MGLIGGILLVLMGISAVLLVLVVLVQDDQGEGIGGIFGGGSNTAFGSRSGNVLTRFTAVLAAVFLVTCFGLAWVNRTPTAGDVVSKARQAALNGTDQQSWWVQTPAPEGTTPTPNDAASPFGAATPQEGAPAPTANPSAPNPTGTGTGGQ